MVEASPEPVEVRLAHVINGRARLRLAGSLPETRLATLADGLAALSGIERVVIRPATGSVSIPEQKGSKGRWKGGPWLWFGVRLGGCARHMADTRQGALAAGQYR
jgi:hypothetical protein